MVLARRICVFGERQRLPVVSEALLALVTGTVMVLSMPARRVLDPRPRD